MLQGIDFSFGGGVTTAQIKAAGYHYVCRYLSGGNSKDISAAEVTNYKAASIPVVFVWEVGGNEFTFAGGQADARSAVAELSKVGASGATVFFAQDVPVAAGTNPVAYMQGASSVIGHDRAGIYGDYTVVREVLNAGAAKYAWQTSGGSGGQWDGRALLRQVGYNLHVGPATVDLNQAAYWTSSTILGTSDDFGQWPRPSAPAPKPTPPGPQAFAAPGNFKVGLANVALSWSPVPNVGGKAPTGYTVELFLAGKSVGRKVVAGTSTTVVCARGQSYEAHVWANGGLVGPPHASVKFTV